LSDDLIVWEPPPGGVLVHPRTGELVPVDSPDACVKLLGEVRELERNLRELKGELTAALTVEFQRQGTKTLEFSGVKAVLGPTEETVWDIEILNELLDCGLPEARFNELVTTEITYKVNASVAKQLSMNSEYASVITRAQSKIPKSGYVSLKQERG
jgi:hypothetical protein